MKARDRRALVMGTLVVLAAWGALRGIPGALARLRQTEASLEQRRELLVRAKERLARLGELDDSIRSLEATAAALPRLLLVGGDDETASVDLMRRVRARVLARDATLQAFGAHGSSERRAGLALADLAVTIETDFRELLHLLRDFENDSALALESVDIAAPAPHDGPDVPERLVAAVIVSAWYSEPTEARAPPLAELGR